MIYFAHRKFKWVLESLLDFGLNCNYSRRYYGYIPIFLISFDCGIALCHPRRSVFYFRIASFFVF